MFGRNPLPYQSPLIVTDQGRFRLSLSRRAAASAALASRRMSAGLAVASHQTAKGQTLGGLVSLPPSRHEGQPFEQVDILFVLQQGPVQRRDQLFRVALA